MLSEIKKFFLERKVLSLEELSLHFQTDSSAMEKMLEFLIEKGFIKKITENCSINQCKGCDISSCNPDKLSFYEII